MVSTRFGSGGVLPRADTPRRGKRPDETACCCSIQRDKGPSARADNKRFRDIEMDGGEFNPRRLCTCDSLSSSCAACRKTHIFCRFFPSEQREREREASRSIPSLCVLSTPLAPSSEACAAPVWPPCCCCRVSVGVGNEGGQRDSQLF